MRELASELARGLKLKNGFRRFRRECPKAAPIAARECGPLRLAMPLAPDFARPCAVLGSLCEVCTIGTFSKRFLQPLSYLVKSMMN